MNKFNHILKRIREVKPELQKDESLAKALEIIAGAFANHKHRWSIPYKQLITFCKKNDLDYEFILVGTKQSETKAQERSEDEMYRAKFEEAQEKIIGLLEENNELRKKIADLEPEKKSRVSRKANGK